MTSHAQSESRRPAHRCARPSAPSPTGVVAVAARVGDELVGIAAVVVHLGQPRAAAGVVLRRHLELHLAAAARGRRTSASACSPTTTTRCAASWPARASSASTGLPLTVTERRRGRCSTRPSRTFDVLAPRRGRGRRPRHRAARPYESAMDTGRHPLVFHRSGFAKLHRTTSTRASLDGRINGQDVTAVKDDATRRGGRRMSEHRATDASTTEARQVAVASAVGATIEWYDFFLYGTAAGLVFDKLYFNGLDGPAAQFAAFATFAVGFVARPVGGLIFGHYGDRIGRKKMLLLTLLIMGVGTAAIGLLPTYDEIGVWAPSPWSCCGCCRASASAASTAAPCCWPWSTPRPVGAASSAASRTSACPAGCCWPPAPSRSRACCPTRRSSPGAGAPASWPASRCSASAPGSGCR